MPHTKRIRMMMGSFSSGIRHSGGNGIFDPTGEISSSPFPYIYILYGVNNLFDGVKTKFDWTGLPNLLKDVFHSK